MVERILWWGNVRSLTFRERIGFAARHGFDALNLSPFDVVAQEAAGESLTSLRRMAADAGLRLTYLDPVVGWLPKWQPGPDAAGFLPFLSAGLGRELDMAASLGCDRILAVTAFAPGRYQLAECADPLSALCEQASKYDIVIVLEAMPMWGIGSFADLVTLWRRVRAPNLRLLFDTWHYCRGPRDDSLIDTLPIGSIDHVQIADGTALPPPGMSLFDECLHHRLPVGEGQLPIDALLARLAKAGHLTSAGPEVFSDALDALQADQIANRLLPGFEHALARATEHTRTGERAGAEV
jgi:sugar phosphate isomerase/epimerase